MGGREREQVRQKSGTKGESKTTDNLTANTKSDHENFMKESATVLRKIYELTVTFFSFLYFFDFISFRACE